MSIADILIFAGFACVLAFVVIVLGRAALRKPQPGDVEMVLVGAAAGSAEAHLWSTALKTAGITNRVVNVGDFSTTLSGTQPYAYEVWVRARDEGRARRVLGL
jgi:ABC-type proline/glycine betaine transport system substrate-binding protein